MGLRLLFLVELEFFNVGFFFFFLGGGGAAGGGGGGRGEKTEQPRAWSL